MLSPNAVQQLVRKFIAEIRAETRHRDDTSRKIYDLNSYYDRLDAVTCIQTELREVLAYRDHAGIGKIVDDLLKSEGHLIDCHSDDYRKLTHEILKALIHLFEHEIESAGASVLSTHVADEIFKTSECRDFIKISRKSRSPFMHQVARAFWKENSPAWKPQTIKKNRTFQKHLLKFLSPDRMIHTVDEKTGKAYRELLVNTMTNRGKLMSPARVDMYLGYANRLFRWAIRQRYIHLNPFDRLQSAEKDYPGSGSP